MHLLEDALAVSEVAPSPRVQSILSQTFQSNLESEEPTLKAASVEQRLTDPSGLSEALGTLYIGKEGASRYFGPSGGAEVSRFALETVH